MRPGDALKSRQFAIHSWVEPLFDDFCGASLAVAPAQAVLPAHFAEGAGIINYLISYLVQFGTILIGAAGGPE
jgi:hypothetical protein